MHPEIGDNEDESFWAILKSHRNANFGEVEPDAVTCCPCPNVILIEGNYTCMRCDSIVSRFIDSSAEWRCFEDHRGGDPTRCGMPMSETMPQSSLSAMIGRGTNECRATRIMRKYHMWNSMPYRERALLVIYDQLAIVAANNGIPKSIIDEAKILYKKISEMKLARGDNRNGLIASSIYMSCKNNHAPRSAKEIAKIFNIKTTTMTHGCKKFQETMQMNTVSTTAEDFISRFCSKLNMDRSMRDICKQVVHIAEEQGVVSQNTPPSIAAGCIYLCSVLCNWDYSKKQLEDACEISAVTISKCYKKLCGYRLHLFSDELKEQYKIV